MSKGGSTNFGATIKVDGEKEFKQALQDANAALRVNGSELKKISAEYADNANSLEALTAKHDALDRTILSQKEKIEILERALESAGKSYGEMDAKTISYQTALNKAQAELAKMTSQLSQNDEEIARAQSGQADLEESLKKTEAALRVNLSALALVDAQYGDNAESTEALEERGKALQDVVESQAEKLENLQKQLEISREATGESSEETLALQEAYNRAAADLENMSSQLRENQDAMDGAGKSADSLGEAITGIADAAGIEVPSALDGLIGKLEGVSASGAALVGLLGGVGAALVDATMSVKDAAGEIDELSHKTGLSVETIQEFNYASEYLEISADQIGSSIAKMVKNMDSAREGTGAAAEAFKELGIRVVDNHGHLKDSEETFYRVIDALGEIKNESDRDALAMTIFGKSAMELSTVIDEGSEGIKNYAQQAREMGYVIGEDQVNKFLELDDAMVNLQKTGEALQNKFAEALLPMLTALFEALGKIPVPVLEAIVKFTGLIAMIVLFTKTVKQATSTGSKIIDFFKSFNSADSAKLKIVAVVAAIAVLIGLIAILLGKKNDIIESFDAIGNSIGKMQGQVESVQNAYRNMPPYVTGNNVPHYASGTQYHPGGPALLGENGPEIAELPAGTRVRTATETRQILSKGNTYIYNITISAKDVKQFNDIVRIVEAQQRKSVQKGR